MLGSAAERALALSACCVPCAAPRWALCPGTVGAPTDNCVFIPALMAVISLFSTFLMQ